MSSSTSSGPDVGLSVLKSEQCVVDELISESAAFAESCGMFDESFLQVLARKVFGVGITQANDQARDVCMMRHHVQYILVSP